MFCKNCGNQIVDEAVICPKCGVMVAGNPSAGSAAVPNHLVEAILTTLFCCLPAGVVAIVYASQVNTKLAQGDIRGAQAASQNAKTWIIVSLCIGLAFGILGIIGAIAE